MFAFAMDAHAQNRKTPNFFADIKSIDLSVNLTGDHQICGIRENDIKSSVAYILSNSPLKRIDINSPDTLAISLIAMNDKAKSGRSLGCSVALNFELWRFAIFKGNYHLVTVWSTDVLQTGSESEIGRAVISAVEVEAKKFIAKWAEQN